jgi:hypothetical protein
MFLHEEDERFIYLMAALGESCGKEATKTKIRVYAKILENIPIEQIEAAAWHLMKTRVYTSFPSPGEIRLAITGNPEDKAIEALAKAEKGKWEGCGGWKSVVFDDPIIHAVIQKSFAGWIPFCEITEEEFKYRRKDFTEAYQAFSNLYPSDIPVVLSGRHDTHNASIGIEKPLNEIIYIGNKQKCLNWINKQKQIGNDETETTTP